MPVLGITGGIATGKTTFVQALLGHMPAALFDADRCAREALESDEEVKEAVRSAFGEEVYGAGGGPNRAKLRDLVFSDKEARRKLEEIIHPQVRSRWMTLSEQYRTEKRWLFVDIPLLYETGADSYLERVAAVACSPAVQQRRMREHRSLDDTLIKKIIGAQMDLSAKMTKADHVIWNDSTVACLDGQAALLARWLSDYYG